MLVSAFSLAVFAQGNLVDPYTGNFNYSVPLMTVPSTDGPGIPISLQYAAGVKMNQPASWVGLGWGLNTGAITRGI